MILVVELREILVENLAQNNVRRAPHQRREYALVEA